MDRITQGSAWRRNPGLEDGTPLAFISLAERRGSVTRPPACLIWNRAVIGAFTGAAWFGDGMVHDVVAPVGGL